VEGCCRMLRTLSSIATVAPVRVPQIRDDVDQVLQQPHRIPRDLPVQPDSCHRRQLRGGLLRGRCVVCLCTLQQCGACSLALAHRRARAQGALSASCAAEIFFAVYEMAIDTIILAFCEDCSANGGEPKYAPELLMEAIGKAEGKAPGKDVAAKAEVH
jgi:hypothetical protein